MIIFDLEWNRGYDHKALDEVLQIGAVKLERLGEPILSTFNVYIHPKVHKKLNKVAKDLPEMQQSLDSQLDFPAAMELFRSWCGEDRIFAAWGADDMSTFRQNCDYWHVEPPRADRIYDLQGRFSTLLGVGRAFALSAAVEYCQIPELFEYHNALHDALYTALVGEVMGHSALDIQPVPYGEIEGGPKKPRRESEPLNGIAPGMDDEKLEELLAELVQQTLVQEKTWTAGPCAIAKPIPDMARARRPACPVCKRRWLIGRWFTSDKLVYYNVVTCRDHGKFLAQLSLAQEGKDWFGILSMPEAGQEELVGFVRAYRGQSVKCKTLHARKK